MNMLLEMLKISCAIGLDVALVTFQYSFQLYIKTLPCFKIQKVMYQNLVQNQKVIFKINLAFTVYCCCPHITPVLTSSRTCVSQQSGQDNLCDTQRKSGATVTSSSFLLNGKLLFGWSFIFSRNQLSQQWQLSSQDLVCSILCKSWVRLLPAVLVSLLQVPLQLQFCFSSGLTGNRMHSVALFAACFLALEQRACMLVLVVLQVTQFASFVYFVAVACVLGLWCLPSFQPFLLLLLFLSQMHAFCHTFLDTHQKSLL